MFSGRISEITAADVRALIDPLEVAESDDFELKGALPHDNSRPDPWVSGRKLSEKARTELGSEIVAFANTGGGTLVIGIEEDKATKRAKKLVPIPDCNDAANRLHQALSAIIEPRLPVFECEGIVTEEDGTSGVVVMRTLASYLMPHRISSNNHCYIRRHDRAEPMSMAEIQEASRLAGRRHAELDQAFVQSRQAFYSWIPEQNHRTHPYDGVMGVYTPNEKGTNDWNAIWAMRLTARPLAPLPIGPLPKQPWLANLAPRDFGGPGRQGHVTNLNIRSYSGWTPRLRAVERHIQADRQPILDRISSEGQVERFVRTDTPCEGTRPPFLHIAMNDLMWQITSVLSMVDIVRSQCNRPTQDFALEVELATSDIRLITGYPGLAPAGAQRLEGTLRFPRYEIGDRDTFNDLLTTFDHDVWNAGGYHPDWQIEIGWAPLPA